MALRIVLFAAGALALQGCIASPELAPKQSGNEHYLTCDQLANELESAQGYLQQVEKDDRFRWSYMFPPTGAVSVFNIMRAKSRANDRIAYIQSVRRAKNCGEGGAYMRQPLSGNAGGYPGGGYGAAPGGYAPSYGAAQPYPASPYSGNAPGYGY